MRHAPGDRYTTADDFAEDLQRMAAGEPTVARVAEGGPLRRFFSGLASAKRNESTEYRSRGEFLGWPLLHVVGGPRRRGDPIPCAKGWIAVGPRAIGAIAIGGAALGGFSLGGLTMGLIAFGGVASGGAATGGTAIGYRAMGGAAIGHVAIGGLAIGHGAIGGKAIGTYTIDGSALPTQESIDFFEAQPPPYGDLYRFVLDVRAEQRDRSVMNVPGLR